ncbi:MAG: hypothetical protein CSA58_05535 [Micrococcales bacterium]|nr:MAG: hypothetical protein CSA58_05535 [Micrococcales bacterium]
MTTLTYADSRAGDDLVPGAVPPSPAEVFQARVSCRGELQAASDRFQMLGQQILGAGGAMVSIWLTAYEAAVQEFVDMEHKVAEAYDNPWLSSITQAHAALVLDTTATMVKAVKETLKPPVRRLAGSRGLPVGVCLA